MKEKDKATNTGRMDEGKRERKKRRAKISPSCFVSNNSAATMATPPYLLAFVGYLWGKILPS